MRRNSLCRYSKAPVRAGSQDSDREGDEGEGGLAIAPAKPQLKRPPLYTGSFLLNDDYTPMEFVVQVLEQFFGMNREKGHAGDVGGPYAG